MESGGAADASSTASPEVPDIIVDIFASLVGSCEAAAVALSVIDVFICNFPALVIVSLCVSLSNIRIFLKIP